MNPIDLDHCVGFKATRTDYCRVVVGYLSFQLGRLKWAFLLIPAIPLIVACVSNGSMGLAAWAAIKIVLGLTGFYWLLRIFFMTLIEADQLGDQALGINASGYQEIGMKRRIWHLWKNVTHVMLNSNYVCIYAKGGEISFVPKDAFASDADAEKFMHAMIERWQICVGAKQG